MGRTGQRREEERGSWSEQRRRECGGQHHVHLQCASLIRPSSSLSLLATITMSLLRASLARLPPPAQGFRALSTSAILREASTPVKVDPSQTRDIVKEQHERQSDAVVADVVNDAPRAYRGACGPEYCLKMLTSCCPFSATSGAAPAIGAHLQAVQDGQLVRTGRNELLASRL